MKKAYPMRLMYALLVLIAFAYGACQRFQPEPQNSPGRSAKTEVAAPTNPLLDSIERPTLLGVKLPNPYTIDNMRRAYQNIKGSAASVTATHYYVRFKPTLAQLVMLEEERNLELFDEPLDYQIAREGDYYQDPTVPDEEITWQYTVVPVSFAFPADLVYQNLASIHIPTDLAVEAEAEKLAGLNADGDALAGEGGAVASGGSIAVGDQPITNLPYCKDGQWDAESQTCIPNCPNGWRWNGTECVDPDASSPPPPAPKPQFQLRDTQLGIQGLRQTRVVVKRWFKIEHVFTDDNGKFTLTKNFRKKVRINVKFKNADLTVRGLRGVRLWKAVMPVKYRAGVFSIGDINRVLHIFERNSVIRSKGNNYWIAATTMNAFQEFRSFASQQATGSLPPKLKVLLSNWGVQGGSGSAPMHNRRGLGSDLPDPLINNKVIQGLKINIATIKPIIRGNDITYGYNVSFIEAINSDRVTETLYHEFAHAAHYNKVGNDFWNLFVQAEANEIVENTLRNKAAVPYGTGNTAYSAIIATGESWAYHIGHWMADQRYPGVRSSTFIANAARWISTATQSSNRQFLEEFDPTQPNDPFRWIPQGLYWDLNDNVTETSPVNDQVSGYTNRQLFNALDADIRSIPAFRDRLLQENNNNQSAQITTLFQSYEY